MNLTKRSNSIAAPKGAPPSQLHGRALNEMMEDMAVLEESQHLQTAPIQPMTFDHLSE